MSIYDERPWLRNYPQGIGLELKPRFTDMLAVWDSTVAQRMDAPCIHYFDHTISFRELDAASDAFAAALLDGGFQRGERVAIYLQNDPQWPMVFLGTWKAGGIAVALNPMFKSRELKYHLCDSGASVLVCLENLYDDVVRSVLDDTPVQRVITTHPADWLGADNSVPRLITAHVGQKAVPSGTDDLTELLECYSGKRPDRPLVRPSDVAILTYTSGTTGPPKGAMNLHGNMSYNSQLSCEWFRLDENDVVLGVAPLFHITGIVLHMGVSWSAGIPLVLFHRFDVAEALRMIERWRTTFTVGAITVFIAMRDHPDIRNRDLSSFSKVSSGGAPVSPAIVDGFERETGIYIHNIYGLTETTSPSHLTPLGVHPPVDERSGALSVGVPVPGCIARVVDLHTREDVAADEVGEIVIEGPMVVPGYWEKPEESQHAIRGGRLHSGDVGFMDRNGWFYIVDRVKDQINAAGYKIWPREVEDVLYQHPAVREATVIGKPDPYRGETVKAFVSLVSGQAVEPEQLIAFCKEQMAAYKYPREIEILDDLPKTPTGKFLRRELRAREQERARGVQRKE